jgi:lysozyme family protein
MTKTIKFDDLRKEYASLFSSCQVRPYHLQAVDKLVEGIKKGKPRYEVIAKEIGCPWWFVGLIHLMECGLRFDRHLHNGDPLTARTTHIPSGRPAGKPPFTFEESALDALRLRQIHKETDWSLPHILFMLEGYNGYGYRQYHPNVLSPYLWSFTSHYVKGKYTADGHFDAECVSQQAGLAAIIKRAVELKVINLEAEHA